MRRAAVKHDGVHIIQMMAQIGTSFVTPLFLLFEVCILNGNTAARWNLSSLSHLSLPPEWHIRPPVTILTNFHTTARRRSYRSIGAHLLVISRRAIYSDEMPNHGNQR